MSQRLPATRPPDTPGHPLRRPGHPGRAGVPAGTRPSSPPGSASSRPCTPRWKARQEAIAERDRKVRRFWLGFGAVIALALLPDSPSSAG